jgi:uncharacterized iron-regulated membrane protein
MNTLLTGRTCSLSLIFLLSLALPGALLSGQAETEMLTKARQFFERQGLTVSG